MNWLQEKSHLACKKMAKVLRIACPIAELVKYMDMRCWCDFIILLDIIYGTKVRDGVQLKI